MNKIEIENKLNELKDCNRIEITTNDRFIRNVYYSSIINDVKEAFSIIDSLKKESKETYVLLENDLPDNYL